MDKKALLGFLTLFLIIVASLVYLPGSWFSSSASAAAQIPLSGYAWSSNIGWISFRGSGYGVNVDSASGNLSGHAWSSNIGWIQFGSLANIPDGDGNAHIDVSGGQVEDNKSLTGWARACAGAPNPNACSGAGANTASGGWDGWIKLSDTGYGVTSASAATKMVGYAWGSDVVGWVDFDPDVPSIPDPPPPGCTTSNCGVSIDSFGVTCSASPSSQQVGLPVTWTATVTGNATGPYAYTWSGTGGLSGSGTSTPNTFSITKTYATPDTYTGHVTVTSSGASPKTATCQDDSVTITALPPPVEICNDTIDNDGDGKIDGDDEDCAVSAGELKTVPGFGLVEISSHSSSQPAISDVGKIKYTGGTTPIRVCVKEAKSNKAGKTGVTLNSIFSPTGVATCRLYTGSTPSAFGDCDSGNVCVDLSNGQEAKFNVKLPFPTPAILDNNPYAIKIGQSSGQPSDTDPKLNTTIILNYSVPIFNPI